MQTNIRKVGEERIILQLKSRKLTSISGAVYVSIPKDWIVNHNIKLDGSKEEKTVLVSIDNKGRLIIEPFVVKK